jgi:hypothetical protein
MVSAAIVALDLARCYGTAPAESGKMGLRPLDRFVDPRGAIHREDAARAGLKQADQGQTGYRRRDDDFEEGETGGALFSGGLPYFDRRHGFTEHRRRSRDR